MAFSINEIKSQLKFDGARGSLFQVSFNNPANNAGFIQIPFKVMAASIPSSTIIPIPIPFMGREIKVAGDRRFTPWNVTIINDEDFTIRNGLEEWHNRINGLENNLRTLTNYKAEGQVIQYSKTGDVLRTYDFHGMFPSEISSIELNWGDQNIETFQVQFEFDWWSPAGKTGNAGGV